MDACNEIAEQLNPELAALAHGPTTLEATLDDAVLVCLTIVSLVAERVAGAANQGER